MNVFPAIPTTYSSVNFRSRLEARWAKFFDLCGWRWEYEPIDLEGYIPDFVLTFYKPILVEVKPEFTSESLLRHQSKIVASSWEGEALLLGATIFSGCTFAESAIGLLADWNNWGKGRISISHGHRTDNPNFALAPIFFCCACCQISFCHDANWHGCSICGCDGEDIDAPCPVGHVLRKWKESGNATQWRKP